MEYKEIRKKVVDALNSIGVMIVYDTENDIDINELISDSIQWISFIIALEDQFDIEWPEELIVINNIASLNAITLLIYDMLNGKEEVTNA